LVKNPNPAKSQWPDWPFYCRKSKIVLPITNFSAVFKLNEKSAMPIAVNNAENLK